MIRDSGLLFWGPTIERDSQCECNELFCSCDVMCCRYLHEYKLEDVECAIFHTFVGHWFLFGVEPASNHSTPHVTSTPCVRRPTLSHAALTAWQMMLPSVATSDFVSVASRLKAENVGSPRTSVSAAGNESSVSRMSVGDSCTVELDGSDVATNTLYLSCDYAERRSIVAAANDDLDGLDGSFDLFADSICCVSRDIHTLPALGTTDQSVDNCSSHSNAEQFHFSPVILCRSQPSPSSVVSEKNLEEENRCGGCATGAVCSHSVDEDAVRNCSNKSSVSVLSTATHGCRDNVADNSVITRISQLSIHSSTYKQTINAGSD